ncbi:MAG TPA: (2Fe-2S)-binding protein [Bryobacteraceae bacterium]|nr:(2Fe-2S)-binding protein [Bryobacteraceae bacterium]
MSFKKTPEPARPAAAKPKSGFSRRGFIGVGLGSGTLGTGLLEKEGTAAPAGAANVAGPGPVPITLNINGKPMKLNVEPRVTLLDALRNHLDLTGAKRVCDRGTCGACTVILNGRTVYSCTVLAIDAQGKDIQTIEGIAAPGKLHPVSQAFWDNDGQQCGYCTPGFVMACKGFLDEHPNPTLAEVEHGLGGNLCRCGTYVGVRKAVLEAAKAIKGQGGKNG